MEHLKCAVVGATGPAGQKAAVYLERHPFLELRGLAASERSAGKAFGEAIVPLFEKLDCPKPSSELLRMSVQNLRYFDPKEIDAIFSTLDSDIAAKYEAEFATHTPVFTSAGANRYAPLVPIHNITVNDRHLEMIEYQKKRLGRRGFILAKSNCTTSPVVSVLQKIFTYGIEYVNVYTEQALSGAGKNGLEENSTYRQMVLKNRKYPYIEGENEKVIKESKEILGAFDATTLIRRGADFNMSALCTRVARNNVHDERVFVLTRRDFDLPEITKAIVTPTHSYTIPTLPPNPISLWEGAVIPERHVERFGSMRTALGEIQKPSERSLTFRVTSDNTGIGAGLGLIASVEYMAARGMLQLH